MDVTAARLKLKRFTYWKTELLYLDGSFAIISSMYQSCNLIFYSALSRQYKIVLQWGNSVTSEICFVAF
jgi:hypothetical protein